MVRSKKQGRKGTKSKAKTIEDANNNGSAHGQADDNANSNIATPEVYETTTFKANGSNGTEPTNSKEVENLDQLTWLKECEHLRDSQGEPYLQLEYQDDHALMQLLNRFMDESSATVEIIQLLYQIWQQTVLSTLLASSALWKKDNVTSADQRQMKDQLKQARYKINFIMHHTVGSMLSSTQPKWTDRKPDLLQFCYQTLQLLPRLAESCPHHKTDIRQVIIHFEGKEFLASVASETWDTLYDFSVPIDHERFIPILRRCAMLDILDKDWNLLGGWDDILKGLEAKCCLAGPVQRLPSDFVLHEHTTVLRNARNSMQCKFFSVRFMRYTEDQAPQRWRYFPKCSAPACANIESSDRPHPFRCKKCWYFHYCSEACQEYCDNIMGLHPKFCHDTPAGKAALCRKETEQHLGLSDPEGSEIVCCACGMSEEFVTDNVMKRCSKCHKVYYCSRQCQEWDWRSGNHKQNCKTVATAANTNENGTTDGGSAVAVVEDENGDAIKDLN